MRPEPHVSEIPTETVKRHNEICRLMKELGFKEGAEQGIFYHDDFSRVCFNMRGAEKKTVMFFIHRSFLN